MAQQQCSEAPVAAFVIIRYGIGRHQSCKNSLTKQLSIHYNYTGAVAGISNEVQCLEGHISHDKGIAILHFESWDDAERWTHSAPEIKQQDWLDGVDMVLVPLDQMPKQGYNYVQIMDIDFGGNACNFQKFKEEHSEEAKCFMEKVGASGGVVATNKVKKIRGLWQPEYLVLNFWKSKEQFESAYNSEDYSKLNEARQRHCQTNMSILCMEDLLKRGCSN